MKDKSIHEEIKDNVGKINSYNLNYFALVGRDEIIAYLISNANLSVPGYSVTFVRKFSAVSMP